MQDGGPVPYPLVEDDRIRDLEEAIHAKVREAGLRPTLPRRATWCTSRAESMTLVPVAELADAFDLLRDRYGFHVNLHHFAILGQCDSCRQSVGHGH